MELCLQCECGPSSSVLANRVLHGRTGGLHLRALLSCVSLCQAVLMRSLLCLMCCLLCLNSSLSRLLLQYILYSILSDEPAQVDNVVIVQSGASISGFVVYSWIEEARPCQSGFAIC